MEYFTKWIEARAVSAITAKTIQKFFWQNIVYHFGVPSKLIVNNGKQFYNRDFQEFCASIGTRTVFTSAYHPQSNRVIEDANDKTFTTIKKSLLEESKGKWENQLPEVLWGRNTTESHAIGFTLFRLMYRAEVMTPQELKHGSPCLDPNATTDIDELTAQYLLNGDRVQALDALNKYQATTKI